MYATLPSTSFVWREADIYVCAQSNRQTLKLYNVHAVVEPSADDTEGFPFLAGCISDDTDEDYIIQTIYERLRIPKGKDGKVGITYIPHKGTKPSRSSFAVREDKGGLADIVFSSKRQTWKEKQKHTSMSVPLCRAPIRNS